jgi:DNA-3-methyladenine glycosylase
MSSSLASLLAPDAVTAARQILGWKFTMRIDGIELSGRIVETEAYDQTDAASHSYKGRTPRTDVMFGPAGHLYVYFTYGMHYCCNVTIGPEGHGAAVLIRALEPLSGDDIMRKNRNGRSGIELTNGPAKVCQALQIGKQLNGHDLSKPPLVLEPVEPVEDSEVVQTTRIGISQAKDEPWRFYIKDNLWVSKQ